MAKKVILANLVLTLALALLLLWNITALSRTPPEQVNFKNMVFSVPQKAAPERLASLKYFFGPEEAAAPPPPAPAPPPEEEDSTKELKLSDCTVRLEGTILAHGSKIAVLLLLPKKQTAQKGPRELRQKVVEGGEFYESVIDKVESHRVFIRNRNSGQIVKLMIFKNEVAEI